MCARLPRAPVSASSRWPPADPFRTVPASSRSAPNGIASRSSARLVDVVEQWVKKGDRIYVEGRLEYSQTQDERGGTRYWTDIIVNEMIMLGSSGGGRTDPQPHAAGGGYNPPPATPITEPEDDLPF